MPSDTAEPAGVKTPAPSAHTPAHVDAPIVSRPQSALLSRPVWAVLTVLGLSAVLELLPGLERYRIFTRPPSQESETRATFKPNLQRGESELAMETRQRAELAQPERVRLPEAERGPLSQPGSADTSELPNPDAPKPPVPLLDASGAALDGFYASLLRTLRKEPNAVTRVVHFGDSIVASDYVTSTLRRKLQARFGDSGHGFMLIANAWPAYFHNDVERYATRGFSVSRVVGPTTPDGFYGLGGVSFKAGPHALARFGTASSGTFGRSASRFVLFYLEQPGGGRVDVRVDGKTHSQLNTAGERAKSGFFELNVPDGPHTFEIETISGNSRLFGAVLERSVAGVVLDAIGIQGARIRFLDEQDDAHWAEQLRFRAPNLLVYQFGANESADGFVYPMADYNRTMQQVLRQGKTAVPDAGCLVIGAMDRAVKRDDQLITLKVLPVLIDEQRKAAADVGCAFFDTYTAMGGRGSMARWVKRGLGQADLTHPTAIGAEIIGNWVYRALMDGFESYRARAP